jgi:hypothetical protein
MKKITLKLLFTVLTVLGIAFNANAQFGGGDADITAYSFAEQTGDATITPPTIGNGTVEIEVAYGTNLNGLVATFELSEDATADVDGTAQTSGVTPNDFVDGEALVYTVTASDGTTTQDWDVIVTVADPSSEKEILDFNLPNQIGDESINALQYTVDVTVAQGTDVSSLVADFVLSDYATANIGGTEQTSGSTANDFTNPVTYTVVAQDGSEQDWTVTVTVSTEDNTEANITAYSFAEQTGDATITEPVYSGANGTVDIEVAYGTDLSALVATFELSYGATADIDGTTQTSGTTPNDFTNTVTYTVTAEDGSTTVNWDVNVTVAQNDQNDILSYSFAEQTGAATIDATNHIVNIEVENGTDLTALVATFTLSGDASATVGGTTQESGVTSNDFSNDVIYTVTAQNGDTQDWTVKVTEATETNISTIAATEISIYPNPSNGIINITNSDNAKLSVINSNGEVVFNTIVKGAVNLSELDNGIYFIKIEKNNTIITKTINIVK